ncbi:hypothetical protein Glove_480g12 [Diversispora epigaea]|uniref:Uncharacterized protein n=1 Tax=Diversispora epigaea TaxID=1348612 RepID=A0A397GPD9_9GLOM|nr:hypothetical protein Glove_480g12 [Diversispora epigaea]
MSIQSFSTLSNDKKSITFRAARPVSPISFDAKTIQDLLVFINLNVNHLKISITKYVLQLGCDFDKRSWESVFVNQQYNVSDSYRNKSDLARSIQAEKRTEKRRKGKQPVLSSSSNKTKKQKNNSNENDENLQINQQQNLNRVTIEKLNIQKQMNDKLEREITLLEKRKQLMN